CPHAHEKRQKCPFDGHLHACTLTNAHPARENSLGRWKHGTFLHCMNDPQPEGHMASHIGRRKFLATLLGAATAWPLAARAQQAAMPAIGFLNPTFIESNADRLRGFHRGLKDAGYVDGENVAVVYRWAEGQNDRLPELAAELVRRQVLVIACFTPAAAVAAK